MLKLPDHLDPELFKRLVETGGGELTRKMGIEYPGALRRALGGADAGRRATARSSGFCTAARTSCLVSRSARSRPPSTPDPGGSPWASRSTRRTPVRSPRAGWSAPATRSPSAEAARDPRDRHPRRDHRSPSLDGADHEHPQGPALALLRVRPTGGTSAVHGDDRAGHERRIVRRAGGLRPRRPRQRVRSGRADAENPVADGGDSSNRSVSIVPSATAFARMPLRP